MAPENYAAGFRGIDYELLKQMEKELAESARQAAAEISQQTQAAAQKNRALANAAGDFAARLAETERELQTEREKARVAALRFSDYQLEMDRVLRRKEREISERDRQLAECRRLMEEYLQERDKARQEAESFRQKGERYDQMKKGLDRIRLAAELKAGKLMEDAQVRSREAIDLVEDAAEELRRVRGQAARQAEKQEDRLEQFYSLLDETVEKMTGLREQFFIKNNIPPEPPAQAAQSLQNNKETPLSEMLRTILGGNDNGTEDFSVGGRDH